MKRGSQAGRAILLLLRYAAAVAVSCLTAFTVLIVLTIVTQHLGESFQYVILIPTGCIGVLAGAFCLPPHSRLSGSIVLVALGIGVSVFQICLSRKYETWESHDAGDILHITLLALGGAAAVFFFIRERNKKAAEQAQ